MTSTTTTQPDPVQNDAERPREAELTIRARDARQIAEHVRELRRRRGAIRALPKDADTHTRLRAFAEVDDAYYRLGCLIENVASYYDWAHVTEPQLDAQRERERGRRAASDPERSPR